MSNTLRCPSCPSMSTVVDTTRPSACGQAIRRYRRCVACDHRFTTREARASGLPRLGSHVALAELRQRLKKGVS